MRWLEHILRYEDFEPEGLYEDLEDKIAKMKELQTKYSERMASMTRKSQEAGMKAGRFKEKSANAKDPLMKKIYGNRASEEQMSQQVYAARLKAVQMTSKLNNIKLKNADLNKTRRERDKQGA